MNTPFTYEEVSLLLRLLIAHLITDFILQSEKGIIRKKDKVLRARSFWLHGLYTGLVAALFIWSKFSWLVVVAITFSHLLIDYLKLFFSKRIDDKKYKQAELWMFITDQLLHGIVLILAWLVLISGFDKVNSFLNSIIPGYKILLQIFGFLIVIGPITYLIRFLTFRWADEIIETNNSLKDAGKWIGMLERVIVLTLVFIEQYAAIGFLVTAKSILRLIDKPDIKITDDESTKIFSSRKHTEYVLIGTFLSFGSALLLGLLINRILKH